MRLFLLFIKFFFFNFEKDFNFFLRFYIILYFIMLIISQNFKFLYNKFEKPNKSFEKAYLILFFE